MGVFVSVSVAVLVGIGVVVCVMVGVSIDTAVAVDMIAFISVGVLIVTSDRLLPVVIINCAGLAPSRLERLVAVLLVVSITKLNGPTPVTNVVTSTCVQVLAVIPPELPTLLPNGGALLKLMLVSPHVLSVPCTM